MTSSPESQYVRINGLSAHYREYGDPGAPDVVFIHGWSTSGMVWSDIAELLKDRFHIIVPDSRGNGQSERPAAGYQLTEYAEDVCQLIDALDLAKPAVVGHSWGANIGTIIAAKHADVVSKVVLEDPVYWKMTDAFATIVPQIIAGRKSANQVHEEYRQRGRPPEEADFEITSFHTFSPEILMQIATVNRDWALECEAHIKTMNAPTLMLIADYAAGGYVRPEELAYFQTIAPPNVEWRVWDGIGHRMHLDDPERLAQTLTTFLA